jgi:hypothetical protein
MDDYGFSILAHYEHSVGQFGFAAFVWCAESAVVHFISDASLRTFGVI